MGLRARGDESPLPLRRPPVALVVPLDVAVAILVPLHPTEPPAELELGCPYIQEMYSLSLKIIRVKRIHFLDEARLLCIFHMLKKCISVCMNMKSKCRWSVLNGA